MHFYPRRARSLSMLRKCCALHYYWVLRISDVSVCSVLHGMGLYGDVSGVDAVSGEIRTLPFSPQMTPEDIYPGTPPVSYTHLTLPTIYSV